MSQHISILNVRIMCKPYEQKRFCDDWQLINQSTSRIKCNNIHVIPYCDSLLRLAHKVKIIKIMTPSQTTNLNGYLFEI